MALYEYQCQKCGARTEVLQKMADPHLTVCESCGGELKRLLSAPAVQFKGAGWYVTDYARKSGPGSTKSEGRGESGGGDSKPAASEAKADKGGSSGGSTSEGSSSGGSSSGGSSSGGSSSGKTD
jgi:putative FmdB family regulatory protein